LELLADGHEFNRELLLQPTDAESLKSRVPAWTHQSVSTTTPTGLLKELRKIAQRLSLPPSLATAIRIDPRSRRFVLTPAQINWLGCRRRKLILHGALTHGRICAPAAWAKLVRVASTATKPDVDTRGPG
jgi:hypothetical protein